MIWHHPAVSEAQTVVTFLRLSSSSPAVMHWTVEPECTQEHTSTATLDNSGSVHGGELDQHTFYLTD